MARYRIAHLKMWADDKFLSLSRPQPNARDLWIFMLIGPCTSVIPGLMHIGVGGLADGLGWPSAATARCLKEILDQQMARFDADRNLLFLPRGLTYNPPDNPNVVKHWKETWSLMPECRLKGLVWDTLRQGFVEAFSKHFLEAFTEACPKPFTKGYANTGTGTGTGVTDNPPNPPADAGGDFALPPELDVAGGNGHRKAPHQDRASLAKRVEQARVYAIDKGIPVPRRAMRVLREHVKAGHSLAELQEWIDDLKARKAPIAPFRKGARL